MVLLPVFVQVALTFALLFWMACARTVERPRGETKIRDIALAPAGLARAGRRRSATATTASSRSRCCSTCWSSSRWVTRQADLLFVVMAWLFVLARLAHAYVHTTSNHVPTRFCVFAVGMLVLLLMWIIFASDSDRMIPIMCASMTPAARLSAAIEVFADIEARRRPAAQALKDWGLSHRFAGSGDRAAIAGLVYDALRRKASSAWIMGADTPRAVLLGMLARERGLDAEAIAKLCDGARFAPAPLTDEEHARLRAASLEGAPAACAAATIPNGSTRSSPRPSATERAEEARGARVARAARSARQHAEGDARGGRGGARRARRRSRRAGRPAGLRIIVAPDSKSPAIHAEPAFLKGQIEIQDEGSQLAALLSGAKPGEQVIDLCAGAGGKTLALAAAMENHGQIYATDTDKRRLAPIHERLERSGARNVQVHHAARRQGHARRSRRPRRPRADRRALHRHGRVAAQSGCQMARAARRARRAAEGSGRGARPRRAAGQARRPHRLCDLLGARRRERRAGARLPGAPSRDSRSCRRPRSQMRSASAPSCSAARC